MCATRRLGVGAVVLTTVAFTGCSAEESAIAAPSDSDASTQRVEYSELIGRGDTWTRGVVSCGMVPARIVKEAVGTDFDDLDTVSDLDEDQQGMILLAEDGSVDQAFRFARSEIDFCPGPGSTHRFAGDEIAVVKKSADGSTDYTVRVGAKR